MCSGGCKARRQAVPARSVGPQRHAPLPHLPSQIASRLCAPRQVHGTWPAVAAALAQQPDQLYMSWQGLGSLLEVPQQQAAWRAVGAMEAAAAAEQGEAG